VVAAGYEVRIHDSRTLHNFQFEQVTAESYSHVKWPDDHVAAGQPIALRDYQVDVINKYLENPQSMQEVSTGAGKTIVTAVLAHKAEPYGRSITIVPSKDLVTQTEEDFINMGLDVGVFFGDRKEYGKTHTICTWQSLEALDKKSKRFDPDITLEDFVEDVICVMVDEAHGSKADVLKKLLGTTFKDCPLRWGMTGTIPEAEHDELGLICSVGPIVNRVRAKDLQDLGVLANLNISVLQLVDPPAGFENYQQELKWLTTNRPRLQAIAEHVITQEGNTLLLIDRIETGKLLMEMIPDAVFINGNVKSKDRKSEYEEIITAEGKVIIATYGVAAVGINVPRIFNLYMFEPGKSFIRVIQSIGRGIRKAKDKDFVDVYDVTSTCKYAKRHLAKRKKHYKSAEYPFKIHKVTYL